MTRSSLAAVVFVVALGAGSVSAQEAARGTGAAASVTTKVRITQAVTADGKALVPGTYELRLTSEQPPQVGGGASANQRWVEFVANGTTVAREIAEVFPFDDARAVGTSSAGAGTAKVQLLKGGEFLRIAVTGVDGRYLIHLPVAGARVSAGAPVQP